MKKKEAEEAEKQAEELQANMDISATGILN